MSTGRVRVSVGQQQSVTPLWFANHEGAVLNQWYVDGGGGEFNSGGVSQASTDFAHSGQYSARLTITTPPQQGVRLFRWSEPQVHPDLYYSVWYYFPKQYSATAGWWNVFQWKSKTSTANDPFFLLDALNRNGKSFLSLFEWQPNRRRRYSQLVNVDIPIGRWFQVEAFYKSRGDSTGQVIIWQDGIKLFDVSGVQTRFSNGDTQWSVNNYSDQVTPSPTVIYIDDAVVAAERVYGKAVVGL
jgi:hypothetical protein